MVRRPFSTFTLLIAGALFAVPALAHPGGGGAGLGSGGPSDHPVGAAAMGHFGGSSLGPGGGPGNFGANGQADNPLAHANFGRSDIDHGDHAAQVRPAALGGGRDAHAAASANSTPAVLDNAKLEAALTRSLTRKGVTLPAGGLKSACAGFHSLGQCVAALHVAQNLDLPGGFAALKTAAIAPNSSLGKAIQQLDPSRRHVAAVTRKADREADADLDAAKG